jgi:ABC-2 type transport system ATP-binding protein
MTHLVEVIELSKRFGAITAVDSVSFGVARGDVLGFLGPNGAGKSTTMKMITGFLPPTSGTAFVAGYDVGRDPVEVKRRIGYLPEGAPLYGDMTPRSFLEFVASIRGLSGAARRELIGIAVDRLQLGEVLRQRIDTLSKGFKRRVGLAQAIVHDPEILVLDEPTDGLDPNQKFEVRNLIQQMASDKAIVISTHILEEVEAICNRAVIIARGRLVADSTPEALRARSGYNNAISIEVNADLAPRVEEVLRPLPDVARVQTAASANGIARLVVVPKNGRPILDEVQGAVRAHRLELETLTVERGRLDDVFREITGAV